MKCLVENTTEGEHDPYPPFFFDKELFVQLVRNNCDGLRSIDASLDPKFVFDNHNSNPDILGCYIHNRIKVYPQTIWELGSVFHRSLEKRKKAFYNQLLSTLLHEIGHWRYERLGLPYPNCEDKKRYAVMIKIIMASSLIGDGVFVGLHLFDPAMLIIGIMVAACGIMGFVLAEEVGTLCSDTERDARKFARQHLKNKEYLAAIK